MINFKTKIFQAQYFSKSLKSMVLRQLLYRKIAYFKDTFNCLIRHMKLLITKSYKMQTIEADST